MIIPARWCAREARHDAGVPVQHQRRHHEGACGGGGEPRFGRSVADADVTCRWSAATRGQPSCGCCPRYGPTRHSRTRRPRRCPRESRTPARRWWMPRPALGPQRRRWCTRRRRIRVRGAEECSLPAGAIFLGKNGCVESRMDALDEGKRKMCLHRVKSLNPCPPATASCGKLLG